MQYRLTADEWTTDTNDWAIYSESVDVENPEFVYVKTDREGKILWAIKTNGDIFYGFGIPTKIKNLIETLTNDNQKRIIKLEEHQDNIENPEYVYVIIDNNNNILFAIDKNGKIVTNNEDFNIDLSNYVTKDQIANLATKEYVDSKSLSTEQSIAISNIGLVPSYYESYIADKIDQFNSLFIEEQDKSDSFIFVTDIHCAGNRMNSPALIKRILENSCISKVIFGGDIPGGSVPQGSDISVAKNLLKRELRAYKKFQNAVEPLARWYPCRGNHDLNAIGIYGQDEQGSWIIEFFDGLKVGATWNLFERHLDNYGKTERDFDDRTSCHYYFDCESAKIRYIIADGENTNVDGNIAEYTISDAQIKWIVENAVLTIPDGWDFIFCMHEPIVPKLDRSAGSWLKLRNLVKAINNKTTYNVGSKVYDLQNVAANVIVTMSGHEHVDGETFDEGVLHVTTNCDTFNADYRDSMFVGNVENRNGGTTTEQCFDIVNVNKDTHVVDCIRVGWGRNRRFHYNQIIIDTIGTQLQLPFTLANITSYKVVDCNNVYLDTSESQNATIMNGLLTAVAQGEVMAVAFDENYNTEFFNIKIN